MALFNKSSPANASMMAMTTSDMADASRDMHFRLGPCLDELKAENKKLKEDFDGWKASYDDDIREARAEGIDELKEEIEDLKEENKELTRMTELRRDQCYECSRIFESIWYEHPEDKDMVICEECYIGK